MLPRRRNGLGFWGRKFFRSGVASIISAKRISMAMGGDRFGGATAFEDVVLLVKSDAFFAKLATDSIHFMDAVWDQMDQMEKAGAAAMRERHTAQVNVEVERSSALQEVHALLGQMADADTDGAVRLEMSRAIRDLQQEVRNVKIQKIELERRLGTMAFASPQKQQRGPSQPSNAEKRRRREETAATRSLHNTAKMLEQSPTLLRLKELEALEKVTEKIDKLTVYGGLDGLLHQLVKLLDMMSQLELAGRVRRRLVEMSGAEEGGEETAAHAAELNNLASLLKKQASFGPKKVPALLRC